MMRSPLKAAALAVFPLLVSGVAFGKPPVLQLPASNGTITRLEVQSWSWGVSQAGAMSPRRDAATGQASGRRMTGAGGGAAAASYAATGLMIGQPLDLVFSLEESVVPWTAAECARGVSLARAGLQLDDAVLRLSNAVITCDSTMPATGAKQKRWLVSNFRLRATIDAATATQ